MKGDFALVYAFFLTTFAGLNDAYQWKTSIASEAVLLRPIPDGIESLDLEKVKLWLCRIYGDTGRWMPGKLWVHQDMSRCIVGNNGNEVWSTDFQILATATGTTSWLPSTGQIPSNAIEAGLTRSNGRVYACRAIYNGSLLLGGISAGDNTCSMPYGHKEVYSRTGMEILVVNIYEQVN